MFNFQGKLYSINITVTLREVGVFIFSLYLQILRDKLYRIFLWSLDLGPIKLNVMKQNILKIKGIITLC